MIQTSMSMNREGESNSGDGRSGFGEPDALRSQSLHSAMNCLSGIVSEGRLSSLRFLCSELVLSHRPHRVKRSLCAKW